MDWTVKVYDDDGIEVEARIVHWQQTWGHTWGDKGMVELTVIAFPAKYWTTEGEDDGDGH